MAALEKFKQLGYKRKQNNKYYIEYIKIDTKYWGEYTHDGTEVHTSITFSKQTKSIDLETVIYSLNIEKKQIHTITGFTMDEKLLDAINEQFAELKI